MGLEQLKEVLGAHGQAHVLAFWERLDDAEQRHLAAQIESIDFSLVERLVDEWVAGEPKPQAFDSIEPPNVIPKIEGDRDDAREAWEAGEKALRSGRVGLVLVAGGQGTRLGFPGPKGAFPIGPITGRTLFEYHADKIINLQQRYGCTLPWYIMVGDSNAEATREFFEERNYLGLDPAQVTFFQQRMMPCVDAQGKFMLDTPGALAMNPNGHGGCIPALVENGILADARKRGIDTLSYFQVDNWAVKVADPYFIGYHILNESEMSSKVTRKREPREAAGVHCVCDGKTRVIEYTELDIYPRLLETDDKGDLLFFAANVAIHALDVGFIERVYERFTEFPWHCSHKKIAHVSPTGERIDPDEPNGYKFETFVFDALEFCERTPVVLEIHRLGEFTPTKQMTGPGSVEWARRDMSKYWGEWLEAAGCPWEPDEHQIEINPQFAWTSMEFVDKMAGASWPEAGDLAIGPKGNFVTE